jgi:hypothetical protein
LKDLFRATPKKHKIRAWIAVKEYEVYVHRVIDQEYIFNAGSKRIIYIEVEYRNQSQLENMSCRSNQWHLFSADGYCFDVVSSLFNAVYYQDKPYFGGDRIINPGRHVRGWFGFEVPLEKKVEYLQFMNSILGTRSVDIDLENEIEIEISKDLSNSDQ